MTQWHTSYWVVTLVMVLLAAPAINRLRGMGISGSRIYASVLFGLLSWWVFLNWQWGLAAGLGFLFWGAFSWGRWFDLGRLPDNWNRDPNDISTFDKTIEKLSFGSDYMAMFARHAFGILPIGVALGYFCGLPWLGVIPAFAALVVLAYEIGWRASEKHAIEVAEGLTGLVWGALLIIVKLYCYHGG
jgi:hypothetical protein